MTRAARLCVTVLVLLSAGHLLAQLTGPDWWADLTQCLLMPAVAAVLLTHTPEPRSRLVRLTTLALFFSWLGDTLPRFASGDLAFLLMVGGFLVAQIVYCLAFAPERSRSVVGRGPWTIVVAALVVIGFVLLFREQAGALSVPVGLYAAALIAMVLLATGVNRTVTIGAIVFLVSDALIGIGAFTDLAVSGSGFWIMATYIAGQSLITVGVIGAERARIRTR